MPALLWDEGTAYDLFVSLSVLHRPSSFGVRPSWAAGVRSRLPVPQRECLEKVLDFLPVPLSWLYLLPAEAKNAAGALHTLAQQNAAERLPSLLITAETSTEVISTLQQIHLRQSWSSAEQEVLRAFLHRRGIPTRPNTINNLCAAWLDLTASGEQFLKALNTYYQVFFQEEEQRIRPLLRAAFITARARAQAIPIPQLIEELSHGVHFQQAHTARQIVLVPSYWASPLVFYSRLADEHCQDETSPLLVLFGIRPESQELEPGELLPDDLVERMKAIADPTRLRILRYLAEEPQSPSQLARQLRLRAPTVIHHLNTLRLAGLVEITLHTEDERAYSLRRGALDEALDCLTNFLTPTRSP